MDDLTKISGIGAATARKLSAAGIDSFAKLAAATHEQFEELKIAGGADDHLALIAAAAALAPQPLDLALASGDQIAAQAAKIEAARLQLSQLANDAVTAFDELKALSAGAPEAVFGTAQSAFDNTIARVHAAVADARALLGVPEDAPLPAALVEELRPLESLPPFVPPVVLTVESHAEHENGAAGAETSIPHADPELSLSEHEGAHAYLDNVVSRAHVMAAAGELAEAGELLRSHRTEIQAGQVLFAEFLSTLNSEIAGLDLIRVTAPVEQAVEVTAKVASRWRIGRQFTKEATLFEVGELASDELDALHADPLLTVSLR